MLKNLRMLRQRAGLSQKQFADMINVSQQSINKYENHEVEPTLETLCLVADYFNTTIDFIVGRTDIEIMARKPDQAAFDYEELQLIRKNNRLYKVWHAHLQIKKAM